MEAVPRLPMLGFDFKSSTENVSFAQPIKQYIAMFYGEDPESYNIEINNLESLRAAAVRPTVDVAGVQLLKKYYCQLHFLKSRFPMEANQPVAINFGWKDPYSGLRCNVADIRFEMMCTLYNIGAIHTQLGAGDSRTTPDGMKMACTHFQCAAWCFQTLKESYYQMVSCISPIEVVQFMQQVCLAQAQECILEKSMMDNRKATIIAKVAVQVVDYYKRALLIIKVGEESSVIEFVERKAFKEWTRYLSFKVAYHKCVALLFQGQQAEEQQKMGERVAFYQAASEQLDEARKLASGLKQQKEIAESLAFTSDVVEGKKKAAKNENEFIYHEEVPDKDALQEVKGASLVKGIPFNINDIEVSGPDIFAKLVPMEAHEAASLYSERKAQMLRQIGELIESKDQALAEFMSSMQLDVLTQMRSATGLPQELVDRAAALSAKPTTCQDLTSAMGKLSNSYQEVESMLNEINELLKEEEQNEKEYQELMGKRPPSMISTDLAREAAKYKEAHTKANDSNQNLHKAMTTHVANLKILAQPLMQLQQQIPAVELPNPNVNEEVLKELEMLISKVEEMRTQRAMLWTQFREAVHQDDITNVLVTRPENQSLDQLFQQELDKHKQLISYIEQNALAQENILKVLVDVYARSSNSRKYLQDVINKRNSTVSALIASFDSLDDLLGKANKGIEFYNKLETNVSKLLQRIKSACKVQQEEREQILAKNLPATGAAIPSPILPSQEESVPAAPKLKDYLDSRNKKVPVNSTFIPDPKWPSGIRPTPVGSEENDKFDDLTDRMASLRTGEYYQYYQNKAATNTTSSYQPISSAQQIQTYGEIPYPVTSTYSDPNLNNYSGGAQYVVPPNFYVASDASSSYQTNYPYSGYQQNYPSTQSSYPQNYPQVPEASIAANPQIPITTQSYVNYPTTATSQPPNTTSTIPTYPASFGQNYSEVQPSVTTIAPQTYQTYTTQSYSAEVPQAYPYAKQSGNYSDYSASNAPNVASQTYPTTSTTLPSNVAPNVYPASTAPLQNYVTSMSYPSGGTSLHSTVAPTQYSTGYYSMSNGATTTSLQSTPHTAYSSTSTDISAFYPYSSQYSNAVQNYPSTTQAASVAPVYQAYPPDSTSAMQNYSSTIAPEVSFAQPNTTNQNSVCQYPQTTVGSYYQDPYAGYYYYQQQYQQDQNQTTNVAATATSNTAVVTAIPSTTTKESNLDLLSGLDFTISQAPLIPQQKPTEPEKPSQKPEQPPATIPVKTPPKTSTPPPPPTPVINKKPLNNSEVKKIFQQEIERFEKFVDTLSNKTLSGPTNLDLKWKEIMEKQDSDVGKKVISVARCYPMKNRFPDILPYDGTRVELKNTKDDYINASWVKSVSLHAPHFIVTQTPLASTINDFWTLCWEQNVETVVCVLNSNEVSANEIYWPLVKGKDLTFPSMVISLMSENVKPHWTERLISISVLEERKSRVIMHLQFTSWPGSLLPNSPESFVNFIKEIITFYYQQRNPSHPVVVQCTSGIGRCGLVCLLMAAILEVTNNPNTMPDLIALTIKLTGCRKNILKDREHLKFAFESFLWYMKQTLHVSGHSRKSSDVTLVKKDENKKADEEEPSDPLSSLDPFWASKKSN